MKKNEKPPAGYRWIFTSYITRRGKRIYAWQYGLRAFRIAVKV